MATIAYVTADDIVFMIKKEVRMFSTVGMIGLGIMGHSMSANMIKDGFQVVGYGGPRSNTEKIAALKKVGGKGADSPREVAERVDVINTCLPSVASLDEVIYGENGILAAGLKKLVIIESSTFPLADKVRIHDDLANHGITMLDCPISGTGAQAVTKDLSIYVSGKKEAFEQCIAVFNGYARSHFYLGEFGNGSKMKYVANLLVSIHNVSAAEAFVLGMKSGLAAEDIYKVVSDGAGSSRMFEVRGPLMVSGKDEDYDKATMKVDIWQKDVKIINDFANSLDCPTPLFSAAAQLYRAAMAQGRAKQDTASVCAILEEWAQLKR